MADQSLREYLIEQEIGRQPEEIQFHFWNLIASGNDWPMAHMLAMRQAPQTMHTDKTFNESRREYMNDKLVSPQMQGYLKIAKQAGISTQGKYYVGGLGRPNDPMAWVSTVDDVKEVCRKKNLTARGLVQHQGTQVPPKKTRMAEDIVQGYIQKQLSSQPSSRAGAPTAIRSQRQLQQLRAEVLEKHSKPVKE